METTLDQRVSRKNFIAGEQDQATQGKKELEQLAELQKKYSKLCL